MLEVATEPEKKEPTAPSLRRQVRERGTPAITCLRLLASPGAQRRRSRCPARLLPSPPARAPCGTRRPAGSAAHSSDTAM